MPQENSVKILFRFYSDILDEETSETLCAKVVDPEKGYYRIENIPFYAPKTSSGDIVWAEYNQEEQMLIYRKTIKGSGNSTVHVVMMDEDYGINTVRKIFEYMGCESEKYNHNYFALEVPARLDYFPIKRKLEEMAVNKIIGYHETSLSERH